MVDISSKRATLGSIGVRPGRQRQDLGDLSGLMNSIESVGMLNPIIVEQDRDNDGCYLLVAGERRFRCAQKLGLKTVPIRLLSTLTPDERVRIELEENIKRKQLDWKEEAKAVALYVTINPGQGQAQIAEALGVPQAYISRCVSFVNGAEASPEIANATNLSAAVNIIKRKEARKLDAVLDGQTLEQQILGEAPAAPAAPAPAAPYRILNDSFLSWAPSYDGPRFNLLHCDFPYGLNMGTAPLQGKSADWSSDAYDDTPDLYRSLIDCLLGNQHRLIADSAHIIFWFSMNYYQETVAAFTSAGFNVNPFPYIWGKSDGRSFLPDPARWPRRGYETALLMSCGDRKIIRAGNNIIWEPTVKDYHLSEKPVPVVQHIMQMYCDESSIVLDPTCGSGSAIVAARSCKAASALGIEIDPQHASGANARLAAVDDGLAGLINV